MKTIASVITFAAILTGSSVGIYAQSQTQMLQMPQEAQWGPAPPMLTKCGRSNCGCMGVRPESEAAAIVTP